MAPSSQVTLADLATARIVTTTPGSSLEAAIQQMAAHHISCLLVLEEGHPVGILTERDIVRLSHDGTPPETPVRAVMAAPLVTVPGDMDFRSGHRLLMQHGIRHLVVVDDQGGLLGIVSESDFRSHLGRDVYARLHNLNSVIEFRNIQLPPETPLATALARMVEGKLEFVIVAEQGMPLGILTERDLPRLLASHPNTAAAPLREVMSAPLQTIPVDTPVGMAVDNMARLQIRHMAVTGDDGTVIGVVSQHRLIEQLGMLLLEESHAHLETRLAWLLNATDVGTWEYDHGTGQLHGNGTLTTRLREWQATNDFKEWLAHLLPGESAGAPYWTAEYQVPGPRDGSHWLSLRGQTSRREETAGSMVSAGIAYEVTEAKRLQRDLEAERVRLRTLVSTVPDLIWLKDPEGVYLACNPMFERFFGARETDIVGKTDYEFVAREQADFFCAHDRKAMLAEKPSLNQEWVSFADDGHKALLETIKTPMHDADGLLIGVLGIARDITATHRDQEQLTAQIAELRRWQDATLGREMRLLELKQEVNALLAEHGQAPRYLSVDSRAAPKDGTREDPP
ncbi:MAG: CBS domain-containing protein [Gallionellaceae bacterium]|nr:CBS domain-containing protein [Gallionellaceae bacterium]